MQTQLLKVVADKESWWEWGSRVVANNPGKTVAAITFGAPFFAVEAPIALGISGTIALGGALFDWATGNDQIDEVPASKASTLHDYHDEALQIDRIYARHPARRARPSTVIAAEVFHSQMINEQMAHIAEYLKSVVPLRRLNIRVSSKNGAKLDGNAADKLSEFTIKGHWNSSTHHELEYREDHPILVPLSQEPYWIEYFPEIKAAITGASRGTIIRTSAIDTSFGLTASIAKQAGIDANWLSTQLFRVEAIYGL